MSRGLEAIDTWVFDLDNTLYPASCRLFDQIDARMAAFIARRLMAEPEAARRIQKGYFQKYGTTLRGLMLEHGVHPDEFLDAVHDIDHSPVCADPKLDAALHRLPGRKLVFTNGTVAHAEKVLARLGVTHHFGDIFDIVHADYIPKPALEPYRAFIARHAITPEKSAMFEDIARNLEAPKALGMTTVLVTPAADGAKPAYVDHVTHDLAAFLSGLALADQERMADDRGMKSRATQAGAERQDTIVAALRARQGEIRRFGVASLKLFGSQARGDAGLRSDADFIVAFDAAPTFDRFMDLKLYLEELLQRPIDLVTEASLRPGLRQAIDRDAIRVA